MADAVLVAVRPRSMLITINRPKAHNALNREVAEQLSNALREADGEPAIRAVVLTGAGDRSFCAGADLKEARSQDERSAFSSASGENPLIGVYRAMKACSKPVIARVNGAALGGGLGLVAGCDLAYAADHACFGTPEVKVGLFPMMISTYLMRQLPERRYWEMAFLGEPLSAREAEACHLVNKVVSLSELDPLVDGVVERLSANSPSALSFGKRALETMRDLSIAQTFAYASQEIEKLAASDDAREGMRAFAERRRPAWAISPETSE